MSNIRNNSNSTNGTKKSKSRSQPKVSNAGFTFKPNLQFSTNVATSYSQQRAPTTMIYKSSEPIYTIGQNSGILGLSLLLCPSDRRMFPWLSKLASCYDRYRWKKLSVRYSPVSSATTSGGFAICFDLDPAVNEQIINSAINYTDVLSSEGALECSFWGKAILQASSDYLPKEYSYLRRRFTDVVQMLGSVVTGYNDDLQQPSADTRLLVPVALRLAFASAEPSSQLGTFFLDYEIEFQGRNGLNTPVRSALLVGGSSTGNNFMPNSSSYVYNRGIEGLQVTTPGSATRLKLPRGAWFIQMDFGSGSSVSASSWTVVEGSGQVVEGGPNNELYKSYSIRVAQDDITIEAAFTVTTNTGCKMLITEIADELDLSLF